MVVTSGDRLVVAEDTVEDIVLALLDSLLLEDLDREEAAEVVH
jgi:hypothetical protein